MLSEHLITCATCGAIIDLRDPEQVLSHGWLNMDSGQYECDAACETLDVLSSLNSKSGGEILSVQAPANLN